MYKSGPYRLLVHHNYAERASRIILLFLHGKIVIHSRRNAMCSPGRRPPASLMLQRASTSSASIIIIIIMVKFLQFTLFNIKNAICSPGPRPCTS